MKVKQFVFDKPLAHTAILKEFGFSPSVIFIFGGREELEKTTLIKQYHGFYPNSILSGCSTSGEIGGVNVYENTLIVTGLQFKKTTIEFQSVCMDDYAGSKKAGIELMKKFTPEGLAHVFVISNGHNVNGSELVKGFREVFPEKVNVTGGLAGDAANFEKTVVINNDGEVVSNFISAIAFYGDSIQIGFGSFGGWNSFGIERSVTKSKGNVLYEIDNTPALDLYKSFLGDKANELPGSALLFPLNLRTNPDDEPVVRTILSVNEEENSLTFAGDIPEGSYVKLMKANVDRLISGAEEAATVSVKPMEDIDVEFALLVSCVGRKLVMKQLVEEEVEAVQDVLGKNTILTGFYSYGEIAPFLKGSLCELHNQTMTITTFSEK